MRDWNECPICGQPGEIRDKEHVRLNPCVKCGISDKYAGGVECCECGECKEMVKDYYQWHLYCDQCDVEYIAATETSEYTESAGMELLQCS